MQKIGRNDLCPCGSGKKYKKCCLAKEEQRISRMREEATVPTRALDWLGQRFPEGLRDTVQKGFYSGLKKSEKMALDDLAAERHELLTVNVGEWLLTDAKITVAEKAAPVRELLLGDDGPELSDVGRQWLSALGERPLSLFEVQRVVPGDGFLLKDLVRPDLPDVWVSDKKLSRGIVMWDILGARLVGSGDDFRLSGAVYPFLRETAASCRAKILRKVKGLDLAGSEVREICGSLIAAEWLRSQITASTEPAAEESSAGETVDLSAQSLDDWLDEPKAALGDRSPLKAMKTTAGKRAVIELVKSYENLNAHHVRIHGGTPFDFKPLREKLGLEREGE